MKKPGHQQGGRRTEQQKEGAPMGSNSCNESRCNPGKQGGQNPATPLEDFTKIEHYHSGGSSSHAAVPKLGKRTVAMGQATCIFSCESHWISKTVS